MTTKITAADFDDWTEEKEQTEIDRLQNELKVRTIIVEQKLIGKFATGDIVTLPLKVKLKALEKAEGAAQGDNVETVKELLRELGDEKNYEKLITQDTGEIINFTRKYFEVWRKINGLTEGE